MNRNECLSSFQVNPYLILSRLCCLTHLVLLMVFEDEGLINVWIVYIYISLSRILRFWDRWIYRKIKQTLYVSQELANFRNCRRFSADFGLRRVPWRHRNAHSVKERLFLSLKNGIEQPCVLIMPDLQELHWIKEPKAERIRATRLGYAAQSVFLLRPEPQADLDHAAPLYTALGDTLKKVVEFSAESITSLKSYEKHSNSAQNSVKATDIRTNATDVETRKNIVQ